MTRPEADRPGFAVAALLLIVAISAAWWALALWPAGTVEPEWLSRTRAACFGSEPGGLPSAGGWVLLIGEPAGMVGMLIAMWGRSLKEELRAVRAHRAWRVTGGALIVAVVVALGATGMRVRRAYAAARASSEEASGLRTRLDLEPPVVALIDQHGHRVSFADYRGRATLLTFAYGHCATMCPTIVRDVTAARQAANRSDVRLVVVTLDPWRDTPERLPHIVSHWGLASGDRVLSGSIDSVQGALDDLGIGRRRDATTGDIEHGATVLFLDERGKILWRLDGGVSRVEDLLRH